MSARNGIRRIAGAIERLGTAGRFDRSRHKPFSSLQSRSRAEWLELGAARVLGWWHSRVIEHPLLRLYVALFLPAACLIRAYIGMGGIHIYTHDAFIVLDGGWRVLNGQRPNIDFFSSLGPCLYLAAATGLKLAHGSVAGFAWVQSIIGAVVGIWALRLASGRLGGVPRALFCAAVVLMTIAPFQLGESIIQTTPATPYNRFGYSLIALVMLEASLAREPFYGRAEGIGGFSTGFTGAILLFLKITYFLWMFPLLMLLIPCRVQRGSRWVGMAAGFVVGFLPFLVYAGGSLGPMIQDVRLVSGAKHIRWVWSVFEAIHFSVAPMALFVFAAAVVMFAQEAPGRVVAQVALIGGAAIAGGYLFLLANNQGDAMPLNAIAAILILQLLNSQSEPSGAWQRATLTLWGTCLILVPICLDSGGLVLGLGSKVLSSGLPWTQFHSARLAGMGSLEAPYVSYVNDGILLLEQHYGPGDTVMSLDFTNPFSFALGIPPARGGATFLQFETDFDDLHHPAPEWLLGGATLVMQPFIYSDGSLQDSVPRIYGPYLAARYHMIGQSLQWKLYRRND